MGQHNLAIRLAEGIASAPALYERLVVVAGGGETSVGAVFHEVAEATQGACVDVSLKLSHAMLELTGHQRPLEVSRLLEEILDGEVGSAVFLMNIELLFLPALKVEPLRLLQNLSRSRTVVVSWPGSLQSGFLVYAEPGHPEFRRYPIADAGVVIDASAES